MVTSAPCAMALKMKLRAKRTASLSPWPKAKCAAIADDKVHPVPCTLRLAVE